MDSIKSITLHHHNKAFIYSIFLGLQPKGSYVLDPLSPKSLRTPLLYDLPQILIHTFPYPSLESFYILHLSIAPRKWTYPTSHYLIHQSFRIFPFFMLFEKIMHPLSSTLLRNQNVQIARSTVAYRFTIKTY